MDQNNGILETEYLNYKKLLTMVPERMFSSLWLTNVYIKWGDQPQPFMFGSFLVDGHPQKLRLVPKKVHKSNLMKKREIPDKRYVYKNLTF